jgi:uncharacterized membrane protein YbhN (UPF0104 family)
LLLRARSILLSLWQSTRLYLVGSLVGTFVPGGIGVDVYRIAALSTFKKNRLVISAVLLERIIGLVIISIFALLTLPFSMKHIGMNSMSIVWAIIAVTVVTIITLFILLQPEIVRRVNNRFSFLLRFRWWSELYNLCLTFAEYRSHLGALLTFIMLTVLELVIIIFINFLAARSLAIDISFFYLICVIPLIQILIRLPISIQAVGIQEGLYVYFLVAAGFSASDGFSVSILLRVAEAILVFLPAAIILSISPVRIHQLSGICDK